MDMGKLLCWPVRRSVPRDQCGTEAERHRHARG
jgi:hypothetical protein